MHPNLLHRHAHSDRHVVKKRRVALVAGVGVAGDIGGPLVLGGVCVAGSDVFVLQRFELLLGAEFVGLVGGQLGKAVRIAAVLTMMRSVQVEGLVVCDVSGDGGFKG